MQAPSPAGEGPVDDDQIPPATGATPDLLCWIWAAFPPRQGHINKTRVAEALGVSRRTLGRWIEDADGRRFDPNTQTVLARRAILHPIQGASPLHSLRCTLPASR